MGGLLRVVLLFLFLRQGLSYRTYYLETECRKGSASFSLSSSGEGSASILRASSRINYSMQMKCRARLLAPAGHHIMVSVREIGFRIEPHGSCRDYLEIQGQTMCQRWMRLDEQQHFSSIDNSPSNEMVILYHTSSGLDNKTMSGYPGFTITFTSFARAAGKEIDTSGNSSLFRCENDNYIWSGLSCDGHNNCGDLSDEDPYGTSGCGSGNSTTTVLIILGLLIVFVLIIMCVATLVCTKNSTVRKFSTRLRSKTISLMPQRNRRTNDMEARSVLG